MKKNMKLLICVMGILSFSQTVSAFTPPSDAKLDSVLANPKMLVHVMGDANGKEAATMLNRIITKIEASNLGRAQKDYLIAYFTARIAFMLNKEESIAFANEIVTLVPAGNLGVVFSGLSVGGGGSSEFMANLRTLAGEDTALNSSVNSPENTLTTPVYNQLVSTLNVAQALPPTGTDSVPPASSGTGTGGTGAAAPAPVIPAPYNGQG